MGIKSALLTPKSVRLLDWEVEMSWLITWIVGVSALLGAMYLALRQKMPIAIALAVVGIAAVVVLMIVQD